MDSKTGRTAATESVKTVGRLMMLSDIVDNIKGKLPDRKENFYDAINNAIALVLRDSPSKPTVEPYFYGAIYRCSMCGSYDIKSDDSFCPKCGQAIDWNGIAEPQGK